MADRVRSSELRRRRRGQGNLLRAAGEQIGTGGRDGREGGVEQGEIRVTVNVGGNVRQRLRSIRFGSLQTSGRAARIDAAALTKLLRDEEGITALEYGLLAAAMAAVLILVAVFFGNRLGNQINRVSAHIN